MSLEENQFEELLAFHCAPVLKKKKVANMFHLEKFQFLEINNMIELYNYKLNRKGLFFKLFQQNEDRFTIYLYQKEELESLLNRLGIQEFLNTYHYPSGNCETILQYLHHRLQTCPSYPHEIGIFLGYPLCDVLGFIKQIPCHACGHWKVYQNITHCQQLFNMYDRCREEILDCLLHGACIEQLVG